MDISQTRTPNLSSPPQSGIRTRQGGVEELDGNDIMRLDVVPAPDLEAGRSLPSFLLANLACFGGMTGQVLYA
jgi:hypothetical protein